MNLLERIWRRPPPPQIDLSHPQVARDPFPHYEALRKVGPVHFLAHHGFWIVLGHEEVKSAFERPQSFSSAPYRDIDYVLLAADPPRHAAIRRLVARHFSAETLNHVTEVAGCQAAASIAPEMDIVADYGIPITGAVAGALIGFAESDRAKIMQAHQATMTAPDPLAAFIEILDGIAHRSILFEMLRSESEGLLAEAELRSLIRLVWLAATTTNERVITRCVLRLMQHEEVSRAVSGDRALLAPFIEEVMRLHPPEHMVPRVTTEVVKLGDCDIPPEALVYLCVSAANRDPACFENPAELRLDRASRRHFAFGGGIHQCVGSSLTRRVVAVAMTALLDRTDRFRPLQPLGSIDHFQTMTALTPRRLMVGLEIRP